MGDPSKAVIVIQPEEAADRAKGTAVTVTVTHNVDLITDLMQFGSPIPK